MPSLTLTEKTTSKDAKPIAVVRGGDDEGKILYLHSEDVKSSNKKEISALKYMKQLTHVKPGERVKLMNQIAEGIQKGLEAESIVGLPDNVKEIYKRIKTECDNDKTIELPDDSTFQPIPNADPKSRDVFYVAGQSGSGKSYFARGIAENYKKLYPDREIYLISKLQEDETLDKMKIGKPKRISLQSLVDDPPNLDEFKECLVIFDKLIVNVCC